MLKSLIKSFILKKSSMRINKTSHEYFDELYQVIKYFDVNSLKYENEYIWPYLRNRLWIQLYGLGNGNLKRKEIPYYSIQKGSFNDIKFSNRKQLKKKYHALEIDELKEKSFNIDYLFVTVTNAAEQVELKDKKIYLRITDPFFEIANTIGNAQKIEFLRVKTKTLEKSKNYFYPVQYIISPSIFKCGFVAKIKFSNLLSILKKYMPSIVHSGELLRKSIDWELHTRDFYIEVLRELNPKVIFLNGFHFHAPLISAAHYLNIITVDLQHGIQVGWNPLYNNWEEMPKEGYQGLPDYFFVWGKKEYKSIHNVFTGAKHKAIISGNPWLERQLELTDTLKESYVKKLEKYRVCILLVLQKQPNVPDIYKDLIDASSSDYLWIVRHHPKGSKFTVSDFSSKRKKNILIDPYIDNISLPQLFRYIHIVVSEGSSVAVEADYFGIYNFIFSAKGKGNYVEEIKNEAFFFIENAKEFYTKLKTLDMEKRISRAKLYEKVNIEQIFKNLLQESLNKKKDN